MSLLKLIFALTMSLAERLLTHQVTVGASPLANKKTLLAVSKRFIEKLPHFQGNANPVHRLSNGLQAATPQICHPERSEATAERSRRTPRLIAIPWASKIISTTEFRLWLDALDVTEKIYTVWILQAGLGPSAPFGPVGSLRSGRTVPEGLIFAGTLSCFAPYLTSGNGY